MNQPILPVSPRKKSSSKKAIRILLVTAFIFVGYYVVLGIGVYSGAWSGPRAEAVLRYTSLPAALVNWQPIAYTDVLHEQAAIEKYNAYLKTSTADAYQQPTEDSSVTSLTKLIRQVVGDRVAKQLGVTVSDVDVQQAYQSQLLQSGNADQVTAAIKEYYGWTPEEFQERVIRPAVIRNKLQEKLSYDEKLSAPSKQQAERVLAIVQEGKESFVDLAKKYSEDAYGATGGDLGFVIPGEQTPEIDDQIFSLELNTVSDVIHTKYGFHIVKPIEKKTVDGQEQVRALIMSFLAPQVDQYLNDQLKELRITVLMRALRWDDTNFRAQLKSAPTTNNNAAVNQ